MWSNKRTLIIIYYWLYISRCSNNTEHKKSQAQTISAVIYLLHPQALQGITKKYLASRSMDCWIRSCRPWSVMFLLLLLPFWPFGLNSLSGYLNHSIARMGPPTRRNRTLDLPSRVYACFSLNTSKITLCTWWSLQNWYAAWKACRIEQLWIRVKVSTLKQSSLPQWWLGAQSSAFNAAMPLLKLYDQITLTFRKIMLLHAIYLEQECLHVKKVLSAFVYYFFVLLAVSPVLDSKLESSQE